MLAYLQSLAAASSGYKTYMVAFAAFVAGAYYIYEGQNDQGVAYITAGFGMIGLRHAISSTSVPAVTTTVTAVSTPVPVSEK